MFKRVDRRRKRKEEEETLGLDEEMKDVLGLQDTDSSESESDASSSSSASSSSASARGRKTQAARSTKKRKRRDAVSSANKDEDNDSDASNDEDEDEGEDAQTADDAESDFSVTIASALREPVRLIIAEPEAWICAICPNKTLKHSVMVKVHEGSRFHQRRFKRIQELAMGVDPDDDLQILLDKLGAEGRPKADEAALSHRAEKRPNKQK
ncbi:hypothetical protein BC834DRAFT_57597 [Gloeopeniophorella convolvens]|nr:hypothetical protein BC834DRAFT_57597 [Gloeopeniophorella convolvens]